MKHFLSISSFAKLAANEQGSLRGVAWRGAARVALQNGCHGQRGLASGMLSSLIIPGVSRSARGAVRQGARHVQTGRQAGRGVAGRQGTMTKQLNGWIHCGSVPLIRIKE